MKKPKLEFKQVWVVEGWQTKLITGMGVFFPQTNDYSDFNGCWLVFFDGNAHPKKYYKSVIYEDEEQAQMQLNREKKSYAKYLQEEIEKTTKKLKELNP